MNGIGSSAGANEGEDVDLASSHARGHSRTTTAADHVDDALGEHALEDFERGEVAQDTVSRQLHHDTVAHNQRGDERRVGFVERIVERTAAQHNTVGRTADLTDDALFLFEGTLFVLKVFQGL